MRYEEGVKIHPGERVDFLMRDGLRIIQHPGKFCFGMDAVLLAAFTTAPKKGKILDLGTGVGVIPLLLAGWGKSSSIDALEVQEDLADMAQRSVQINKLSNGIRVIHGDLRQAEIYLKKNSYTAITCNPPYIPVYAGVVNQNRAKAIAKVELYCKLDDVAACAAKMLQGQGFFYMIYKPERFNQLMQNYSRYKLVPKRIKWVYSKAGENAELVLVESQKAGKEGLTILPPLFVYDERGQYTPEMMEIYKGLAMNNEQ